MEYSFSIFFSQSFGGLTQVERGPDNPKNLIFTFKSRNVAEKVCHNHYLTIYYVYYACMHSECSIIFIYAYLDVHVKYIKGGQYTSI